MSNQNNVLELHCRHTGVLQIEAKLPVTNKEELSKAYTPGIAEICKVIAQDESKADEYTIKGKTVAVITDGSAVLGLGNIGPKAGLPVVEGKALLYRQLSGVNAFPLCIRQTPMEETIETIKNIAISFRAIHLEDIKAPECFEIERQLMEQLDIPVYHDDQHGTAIAVLAALYNSCLVTHREFSTLKVVICGAGASGLATAKLLLEAGLHHLILVDRQGILSQENVQYEEQEQLRQRTNPEQIKGSLQDALKGADVFVGLSDRDVLHPEDLSLMAKNPIIFALANPVPEIDPAEAHRAGAAIVATGSSKYPNQINNVLVFPGLFKGILQSRTLTQIDTKLKIRVAHCLAELIEQPTADCILPSVFDERLVSAIENTVLATCEETVL